MLPHLPSQRIRHEAGAYSLVSQGAGAMPAFAPGRVARGLFFQAPALNGSRVVAGAINGCRALGKGESTFLMHLHRDGGSLRGASQGAAGSVRVHQKGCELGRLHGLNFLSAHNRLGNRLGIEFFLSGGTPMDQREFPLLGRLDAPSAVPKQWIRHAKTYRQAVRLAWSLRRVQNMTRQQLATEAELYPQHVTDYLAEDDKPARRDLPADAVARFEAVVGNTLVSQWLAAQSKLTVLEQTQADARVAA